MSEIKNNDEILDENKKENENSGNSDEDNLNNENTGILTTAENNDIAMGDLQEIEIVKDKLNENTGSTSSSIFSMLSLPKNNV